MCLSARVLYSEGVIFLCCVELFTFCWVNVLASFMLRTCIMVFCCTWSAASAVFPVDDVSCVGKKPGKTSFMKVFFESGQRLLALSFLHSLATCTKSLHVFSNHVSLHQATWHKQRVHVRCFRIKNPRLQVFNGGINQLAGAAKRWDTSPTKLSPTSYHHLRPAYY